MSTIEDHTVEYSTDSGLYFFLSRIRRPLRVDIPVYPQMSPEDIAGIICINVASSSKWSGTNVIALLPRACLGTTSLAVVESALGMILLGSPTLRFTYTVKRRGRETFGRGLICLLYSFLHSRYRVQGCSERRALGQLARIYFCDPIVN